MKNLWGFYKFAITAILTFCVEMVSGILTGFQNKAELEIFLKERE